eukprot:3069783-Heterocapsa_arctica.AAC.1
MEPLHEDAFAVAENGTRDQIRARSKRGLGRSHADEPAVRMPGPLVLQADLVCIWHTLGLKCPW